MPCRLIALLLVCVFGLQQPLAWGGDVFLPYYNPENGSGVFGGPRFHPVDEFIRLNPDESRYGQYVGQVRRVKKRSVWSKIGRAIKRPFRHVSIGRTLIAGGGIAVGMAAINRSAVLRRRPLMRRTLRGVVIGTGTGFAVAKRLTLPGLIIGGVAGAGVHGVKRMIAHHRGQRDERMVTTMTYREYYASR